MVDRDKIEHLIYHYFEDPVTEEKHESSDYTITADGTVQMHAGLARFRSTSNGILPVQFSYADGDFLVPEMGLTTLKGCPPTVNGDFDCSYNKLKSLIHGPRDVGYNYDCSHNQLTSLEHCPPVHSELVCNNNLLSSLASAPPCDLLYAIDNPIQSFEHTPSHINHVVVTYQPRVPLLGLLSVKKIELLKPNGSHVEQLEAIMNKYAGQGQQGALACAAEMADAGFKENARW